jgi:hypothetical protein
VVGTAAAVDNDGMRESVSTATPQEISKVHKKALLDPRIKSLYYLRSRAGIQASKRTEGKGTT